MSTKHTDNELTARELQRRINQRLATDGGQPTAGGRTASQLNVDGWAGSLTRAGLDRYLPARADAPPPEPPKPPPPAPQPSRPAALRVALCVGHSRRGDSGAVAVDGTTEHEYNTRLVAIIRDHLAAAGVPVQIWNSYPADSYGAAQAWLRRELTDWGSTVALEHHFNAFSSPSANGYEYLHWPPSSASQRLAQALADSQGAAFPGSRARGTRGVIARGSGAGSVFLAHASVVPAVVITEPFFGTHFAEWRTYSTPDGIDRLAHATARGILATAGVTL